MHGANENDNLANFILWLLLSFISQLFETSFNSVSSTIHKNITSFIEFFLQMQ